MVARHLRRSALLVFSCVLLASCSDAKAPTVPTTPSTPTTPATPSTPATPATPTSGTLAFDVVTTGVDVDADGFLLSIDGGAAQALAANGTTNWTGPGGPHTLAISGLAFNCDLTTAPASASVTLGQTTTVTVRASCTPYLQNAIVYTSAEFGFGEIMAMRPDGSRRVRLTTDQQVYSKPVVSPDGQSIVAAVGKWTNGTWAGFDGIYVFDRFGKTRTKVVGRSSLDGSPAWSPDGTRLAFRSMTSGPFGDYGRIWVVGRDGSNLHQLTPEEVDSTAYSYDDSPAWSPDGTQVLYSHSGDLWLINADGSAPTAIGISGGWPAWSPDGSKIAFTWAAGGPTLAIWVANRDGSNQQKLTTPIQADEWARWSLDGKQMVFTRVENNTSQLYRMNADGTNVTKLSVTTKNEDTPSWNPGT